MILPLGEGGMAEWWYADGENRCGPVERAELQTLLQTGKINRNTIVWQAGSEDRQPLAQVNALHDMLDSASTLLPSQKADSILVWPRASRWPRFFGRMFDLWWEAIVVSFVIGLAGAYSSLLLNWMNAPYFGLLFGLICIPIALFLDAIVYKLFGNTPGKWMLNLVVTASGDRLSLLQYLRRNVGLWVSGLALGLPFCTLFTMLYQSSRLGYGKPASYDEALAFSVRQKPLGLVRTMAFATAFISLFAIIAVLNVLEMAANREAVARSFRPNVTWTNPATHISVQIDSIWKASVQQTPAGEIMHVFTEPMDRAIVIFAVESIPDLTIQQYVEAFKQSASENVKFVELGQFSSEERSDAWQGYGTMIDVDSNRYHAHIFRSRQNFWRLVTVQAQPYDYSDKSVADLKKSLFRTVPH
jgi:hypothetical protein